MEDEIDLRKYVDALVRRWKWIAGLTVLAALLAGIISFIIPPTYEATASVYVLPDLGRSLNLGTSVPPLSPQTQLALLQSGSVAQRTIQLLGDKLSAEEVRALLRGDSIRVSVDNADKSLFKITAQGNAAQKSMDIANTWASAGADEINKQYDQALNLSMPTFQRQVETSTGELQTAEENLKQMQRDLQIDMLTQELTTTQQILNSQSAERENVKLALAQAIALKQQVQQGQISLSAEMLLSLQSVATASDSSFLVQPSQFANLTQQQQSEQLDAVIAALNGRQQTLSTSIPSVSSRVASLQQQINDKLTTLIEPTRKRDTARTNYDRATAQWRDAQTRLATLQDPAYVIPATIPPDSPISPKKALNIGVAAVLGLLVSALAIIGAESLGRLRPA